VIAAAIGVVKNKPTAKAIPSIGRRDDARTPDGNRVGEGVLLAPTATSSQSKNHGNRTLRSGNVAAFP
jgi:hypothetical protein